jgi:hypothetical protein
MGTRNVQVGVYRTVTPFDEVVAEIERTSINTVTIRTLVAPIANEYTVIISAAGTLGAGDDRTYVHTQGSPSASWSVNHGLNKFPTIGVVDSGGTLVMPDVHYDTINTLTITFGSATSGKVYCN